MDTQKLDRVMERIRKLLALSKDKANEHEASSAAEKVQALLAEYNLSESDISVNMSAQMTIDGEIETDSYPWRQAIANSCAAMFFCVYVLGTERRNGTKYDRHYFVGMPHNVEVCKLMFVYFIDTVERLARDAARHLPENKRSPVRTSFRKFCTHRLCVRMKERMDPTMQIEDSRGKNLPVVSMHQQAKHDAEQFLTSNFPDQFDRHELSLGLHKGVNWEGAVAGMKAGDEIGLDPQLTKNRQGQLPE